MDSAKVQLGRLASRQFGVVARRQLAHLATPDVLISRWMQRGDLHRVHRGVYAVGHTALSIEGELTAAVLYAGPDAMLRDATGLWWLRLTSRRPAAIEVSTPRRCASQPGIDVHERRPLQRFWHAGIPVAPVPELLLGYAATHDHDDIRYVLARAEYDGWLDLGKLKRVLGRGRPGSSALKAALAHHEPQLARTRSEFERQMLRLCERYAIPVPEFNVTVEGELVDAFWREQRVIVELDGKDAHSRWGQIQRDRERDLKLRAGGCQVLRYTWRQLERDHAAVAEDLLGAL